jgi:hypothetical protein
MNKKNQNATILFRLTVEDKELIERKAKEFGFVSISEYLRYLGKNCKEINIKIKDKKP